MADDDNNFLEEDDFSSDFAADDDFSGTDLFGDDDNSDESEPSNEYQFDQNADDNLDADKTSEFSFTDDDDDIDEYEMPDSGMGGDNVIMQWINKIKQEDPKKLAVPAGIAVFVLIIIFFGLSKLFSSDDNAAEPSESRITTTKTTASPSATAPITMTTKAPESPTTQPTNSQQIELPSVTTTADTKQQQTQLQKAIISLQTDTKNYFSKSESDIEGLQSNIEDLQKQTVQNSQNIQSIENSLANLIKNMNTLTTTLEKTLDAAQKNMKSSAPPLRKDSAADDGDEYAMTKHGSNHSQPTRPSAPAYYVQAIIPGRAWLKDAQGKIVSVGIGDQVQGYGVITQINPRAGIVITSSGAKIEYGISQY